MKVIVMKDAAEISNAAADTAVHTGTQATW